MAVGDAHVFPSFLTPVLDLTQLFFPKPPTTFLTRFCRGEKRKYSGKKVRLNRGSNLQPPGHETDTLTIEPPGRDSAKGINLSSKYGKFKGYGFFFFFLRYTKRKKFSSTFYILISFWKKI